MLLLLYLTLTGVACFPAQNIAEFTHTEAQTTPSITNGITQTWLGFSKENPVELEVEPARAKVFYITMPCEDVHFKLHMEGQTGGHFHVELFSKESGSVFCRGGIHNGGVSQFTVEGGMLCKDSAAVLVIKKTEEKLTLYNEGRVIHEQGLGTSDCTQRIRRITTEVRSSSAILAIGVAYIGNSYHTEGVTMTTEGVTMTTEGVTMTTEGVTMTTEGVTMTTEGVTMTTPTPHTTSFLTATYSTRPPPASTDSPHPASAAQEFIYTDIDLSEGESFDITIPCGVRSGGRRRAATIVLEGKETTFSLHMDGEMNLKYYEVSREITNCRSSRKGYELASFTKKLLCKRGVVLLTVNITSNLLVIVNGGRKVLELEDSGDDCQKS